MKRIFVLALLILALSSLLPGAQSFADSPQVSNIQVQQQPGSYLINITYDLLDPEGDPMYVSAVVSVDGDDLWSVPCRAVSGDVGFVNTSGNGKTIVWDAYQDYPDFQGTNCYVRIFATDVYPFPELDFFRIVGLDTIPMSQDTPDTIGFGRPLQLMWQGRAPIVDGLPPIVLAQMDSVYPLDDGIVGYKWRIMGDNCIDELEDCWHPRLFNEATGDSFSYFQEDNRLHFSNDGTGNTIFNQLLPSGELSLRVNARDIAASEISEFNQGFSFVVNYDPVTIMLNNESDWDHPEDPEIYPYYTLLNDPGQTHYPFGDGDHIPDRTYVVFKALFKDDQRDIILDPGASMGVSGNAMGTMTLINGGMFSFQTGYNNADYDPTWPEGPNGFYADTLGFMPSPQTEFLFNMAGVDEHDRLDGTPASLSFSVGYPPCVQCLEVLPNPYDGSAFTPELACYEPDSGSHPCFGDTSVFYIKNEETSDIPGRTYMGQQGLMFLAINKVDGTVEYSQDQPNFEDYYIFPAKRYRMAFLMHGRDDPREAWNESWLRTMAWKYQVDYDCDPLNSIADGGGVDDLQQVSWGAQFGSDALQLTDDGAWKVLVDVVVPEQLLTLGPESFRLIIQYAFADGDPELTDDLFNKCIRQFSQGMVQGVALDQSLCGVFPVRPAKYHLFHDVRPPEPSPGSGTWRDCIPVFPDVSNSLDLSLGAMFSRDNQPVQQYFKIVYQGVDADLSCDPEEY